MAGVSCLQRVSHLQEAHVESAPLSDFADTLQASLKVLCACECTSKENAPTEKVEFNK